MANLTSSPLAKTDALQSILSRIKRTLQMPELKPLNWDCQRKINRTSPTPQLDLPFPEDIDNAFDDFAASRETLNHLNSKYRNRIEQLQQVHRQKFEESCEALRRIPRTNSHDTLPVLMNRLRETYQSRYNNQFLPMMRAEISALRLKYAVNSESKKTPFNTECTPLLEKYFEYNAYPSAPDRLILAQKTAMTPRQIEVWFQNHRKRARQSGKIIRRMVPNLTQDFHMSLGMSSNTLPKTLPADNCSEIPQGNDSTMFCATGNGLFDDAIAPRLGTFPVRFCPQQHELPTNFTFSDPIWPRVSRSQTAPAPQIDMDDLVLAFASKLHMRDGLVRSKNRLRSSSSIPWFSATTTIPPCAPHPALLRIPDSHTYTTSAIMTATSATSIPLRMSVKKPRIRKTAPFAKRHPSNFHPYVFPNRLATRRMRDPSTLFTTTATAHFPSRQLISLPQVSEHASWMATLESTPPHLEEAQSPDSEPSFAGAIALGEHVARESRIVSTESTSSFGSRTSSFSVNSPPPSSPIPQPRQCDPFIFNHEDPFFTEMADFDHLLLQDPSLSFDVDLFTNKQFDHHYQANGLSSFSTPIHIQALS